MVGHFIEEQSVLSSGMPGASYTQYPPLQHLHHAVDHSHFSPPGLVGEHDLVSFLLMRCSVTPSHSSSWPTTFVPVFVYRESRD